MSDVQQPPPPGYEQAGGFTTVYPPPATQPAYPPSAAPQTGYPAPQTGYPAPPGQQPGYQGQQTGYPAPQTGYPAPPGQQPGYQGQQTGYPAAQAAYPNPQGGAYGGAQTGPGATTVGYAPPKQAYATVDIPEDGGPVRSSTHVFDDSGGLGTSFSDKAIRRAFIRKVYLILVVQLLVTVGFISWFLFHEPTRMWVYNNAWFYWCSYATFLVTYISLVCCPGVRRAWPANFICLAVFTLAFSYMTATISGTYDTKVVLIAGGITAAVCLSISLFAIQTKIDFTMCTSLIFALCMVVFFFGIACMIVYICIGPNYILQCVYGALAALLFSLFLAYDTQMLVGGRKFELSPEEYIFGALQLYLDIVYLFLIILSFFGKS